MIEIKNLTIQFNRQPPVVEDMSLTVPEGGRTIILGESGSGKSVTLAAILGILPSDAAVRGSIKIGGTEVLGLRERELRKIRGKVIGYVPQGSGNGMNPLMTVGEQVSEPLVEHSGLKKDEALQKAKAWMERLGLTPADKLARAYPHTLSGGMRQRALMAMGAAGGARILLADEPTKGLDEKRIAEVKSFCCQWMTAHCCASAMTFVLPAESLIPSVSCMAEKPLRWPPPKRFLKNQSIPTAKCCWKRCRKTD